MKETTVDLTPGPERPVGEGYRHHQPITDENAVGVFCDGCDRVWPREVVEAYRAGREDAAKAIENANMSGRPGGRALEADHFGPSATTGETPDCYDCGRQWADCTCEGPLS